MSASQLIASLTRAEVNGKLAPDCRRVLREERYKLTAAVKSGYGDSIKAAMDRTTELAGMWGVELK